MSISTQFHAEPQELRNWVAAWAVQHHLWVTLVEQAPFKVTPLSHDAFDQLEVGRKNLRLAISLQSPDLTGGNFLHFCDLNPDRLTIDIGALSEKGLSQSWFATQAETPSSLKLWKSLAGQLKRRTKAGATAVNPTTGASCRMRSFRYSETALNLQRADVPMLPVGGARLYFGAEPPERTGASVNP